VSAWHGAGQRAALRGVSSASGGRPHRPARPAVTDLQTAQAQARMTGLNLPILRQLHEASREGECRARWLDLHLAQLLVERGQLSGMEAESLALAAALLSYQVGQGEVCLDLRRLPSQPFGLTEGHPLRQRVARLTAEDLRDLPGVGAPGELAPLILAGPRLYLHKYWCYEQQVREALAARANQPNRPLTPAQRKLFAELFPQD